MLHLSISLLLLAAASLGAWLLNPSTNPLLELVTSFAPSRIGIGHTIWN